MPALQNPFFSPKSRLKRANQHIERLRKRVVSFFKTQPYRLVVERSPDGAVELHKIRFTKRLSEACTHSAAEALEALRSTLDQTAYSAAKVSGNARLRRTQFPIGNSIDGLDNLINGMKVCADIPPEIVALFKSFKPYKGGNNAIYALNKLRNSTHTALTPMIADYDNVAVKAISISNAIFNTGDDYDERNNEIVFGRVYPGGHLRYNADFSFYVSLSGITKRQQAFAVLSAMSIEVGSILQATEAECRRLGYIT